MSQNTLTSPAIAALAILNRATSAPLHIALFHTLPHLPPKSKQDFHWLLYSCLDIFGARGPPLASLGVANADPGTYAAPGTPGDYGLLHAINRRLACFGYVSATGVKYIVVVDMEGKAAPETSHLEGGGRAAQQAQNGIGIRNSDLVPVYKALQRAYLSLMRNPFWEPEDDVRAAIQGGMGPMEDGLVKSKRLEEEVRRIGEGWYPGVAFL